MITFCQNRIVHWLQTTKQLTTQLLQAAITSSMHISMLTNWQIDKNDIKHIMKMTSFCVCDLMIISFLNSICLIVVVVARAPWTVSSVDICRDLHWLPVSHRVSSKLCLITWKTLHTAHPPYLSELITHYHPSRA